MPAAPQQFLVGEITVTVVVESETQHIPPAFLFVDLTPEIVQQHSWLVPDYADEAGFVAMRIQAFVVRTATRTVLVDPCVGNGKTRSLPYWHQLSTPWMERLRKAGVEPADIDVVVHTHLHQDHLGWDTIFVDGRWQPTFPNARHLYTQRELEWACDRNSDADPVYADSIEPIIAAGLADIVAEDADLGEGLRLAPSRGHTPGHVSLWVTSGGETALITGDFMHHPVQFAEPQIAEVGDVDCDEARATRRRMITEAAECDALMIGTHFPVKPAGRPVADGDVWRFVPVDG